ncbi:MAG: DUF1285 domain-containing protein [Asticcacaulis sp.]|nr:DUF1285 domain-containing protein [Asticcacaulis sp.]
MFPSGFDDLPRDGPLPVELWDPPVCGEMDLRIARDGTWYHEGTPIRRPALVRLFSRVLRKDDERYYLVTPVEKLGIQVEDVPFQAVEMAVDDGRLVFRTDVGDVVTADRDHPFRFVSTADEFIPYVRVRGGLEARLTRSLAQEIAARVEEIDGQSGIRSGNDVFLVGGEGYFSNG